MTDPTSPGSTRGASDRASPATTPLWVWLVGIVVLGTSLAMIVSMSAAFFMGGVGGGGH